MNKKTRKASQKTKEKQCQKWLIEYVSRYGIDMTGWQIELVKQSAPSNFPSHLSHSGEAIYATHPDKPYEEIFVDNVWLSDEAGEILEYSAVVIG